MDLAIASTPSAAVSFLDVITKPLNQTSCTVSPSRLAINRKMFRGGAEMDAVRTR
jgi:hypothetical protein